MTARLQTFSISIYTHSQVFGRWLSYFQHYQLKDETLKIKQVYFPSSAISLEAI